LIIEPLIAQRFNAYAMYARPREIGGLLRVVEDDDGNIRVIDLRIFPHLAASSGYFELDGAAVAQNNLDLARAGRKDEISQWCSLIHSHPGFEPFLSSTDCENVLRLAGGGRAHSLICSAADNCADNYYAWHYAQGGAFPMVVCDLAYETDPKLAGIDLLSATELKTIAAEVEAAFVDVGGYTRRKP
jgi:proteasome lid subunit RPN8/RPN11